MMQSRSVATSPAFVSALRAAATAMSLVGSSGAAMCRSFIPVRVTIHSSDVSNIFSRSAFVRTFAGTWCPTPAMRTPVWFNR